MVVRLTILALVVCCASTLLFGGVGSSNKAEQLTSPSVLADTSAPDAWGYTWVRSTDPGGPTFRWIDITTRGILVTGLTDDNNVGPFPVGFAFPYYWYTFNQFRIGSNGYITSGDQTANFAPPFALLPNTSAPNNIIAALVGDLVLSGQAGAGGQCYYWTNAVDSLVISFINVTEWEQVINPSATHTFQIILSKADSTVVFQYGAQNGTFNSTNNTRLCIGIENATGQIGRSYGFSTAPPHAFLPTNGLAIRFKRTTDTGLQVTDAGIVGGLNSENVGDVVRVGQPYTVRSVVRNFGTAVLSNVRVTSAITKAGQPTLLDTVFIPTMAVSEQTTVTFPRIFTPAVATAPSYTATFTAFVTGDVGPGNNIKTAELASVALSTTANTRIAFENGTSGGSINWIGGGGMGVAFDLPQYPVRIESVSVQLTSITAPPMLVEILSGSSGSPGTVLATRSVASPTVGTNFVDFRNDSVRIQSGRFFVGARGQMAFTYETTVPISFRSWEYTGGWSSYRSRDLQDVIIRVMVRLENPVSVGEESRIPGRIQLSQNYPNPFNPSTRINYSIYEQTRVTLAVFDLIGREVRTLLNNETITAGEYVAEWDGKDAHEVSMPSGTYFVRLTAGIYSESKKLMLLK